MLSARDIILDYVCPCLGVITANIMFAAPVQSVRNAAAHGTLGTLNPTPWAFMTGACTGWITYSFVRFEQVGLRDGLFIWLANGPGFILSIWLNMAAVKLQYCDRVSKMMRGNFAKLLDADRAGDRQNIDVRPRRMSLSASGRPKLRQRLQSALFLDEDAIHYAILRKRALDVSIEKTFIPAPQEKLVLSIVAFYLVLITTLSFLELSADKWKGVIGAVVNTNQIFFYGAPLSTIYTVIKTRDSSSIHRRTMLLNTFNAVFWTAYGFAVPDWVIWLPNGLGAILGFAQLALRLVFPISDAVDGDDVELGTGETVTANASTTRHSSLLVDEAIVKEEDDES